MDSFLIRSASGPGSLEFFERTPSDPDRPLERYLVRLIDQDLSAVGRVYVGYDRTNPAPLFRQMAESWKGWAGEIRWESTEGELALSSTQDRTGHVSLRVTLRSGPGDQDWTVRATIWTEAGQLEDLALRAGRFFGSSGE